jgi:hypothetical protein
VPCYFCFVKGRNIYILMMIDAIVWIHNELGSFYYQTLPHIYLYASISPSVIMHSFTMCTTWTHIMVVNTLSMTICMFRLETRWTEFDEIWYDYNRIENGRKLTCFETHACFVKINYFVQFWSEKNTFVFTLIHYHYYFLKYKEWQTERNCELYERWHICGW